MTDFEFRAWPKTPRLNRSMLITEKIDGTNACVIVSADGTEVGAQSRNRVITPEADNAGFARWVYDNAGALADTLGPGYHYGEWWGSGIQRDYGLTNGDKRFSLFNADRWQSHADELAAVDNLGLVPVLHRGAFDTSTIDAVVADLARNGSEAQPGFAKPEGVIVYLPAARQGFKVLIENDDIPKGLVA
ncbi:RNA ligase family protein [Rhodococcus sp. NPDC019627]|uniref:RNA ligase family protein n=1 Tax=unclassified Rhodococcus (in: high G+C Gram-positive bacteria) TaxID=192944 RepID=UPI0033FA2EB1